MSFSTNGIAPPKGDLGGWVMTGGSPSMKIRVRQQVRDGAMVAGTRESTKDNHYPTYTAYENVASTKGRIVPTPNGGTPVILETGVAFAAEKDFKGFRKVEEDVLKHVDFVVNA